MAALFYEIVFAISFLLTIIYFLIWKKHFEVNITVIFIIIPITNLGYVFLANADDIDSIIMSIKITYLGGCFLPFFITMCVLNLCDIKISKLIKITCFILSSIMFIFVLTIGEKDYFYKSVGIKWMGYGFGPVKEYGPMHTVFYVIASLYVVSSFTAIIYSIFRKRQVPNRLLYMLFIPEIITLFGFFGNSLFRVLVEIVPLTYLLAQIMYILIVKKISIYKVADMVVETMVQSGEIGFITTDLRERFLGANETAKKIIPKLNDVVIDQRITECEELDTTVNHWLLYFEADGDKYSRNLYRLKVDDNEENDKFYIIQIKYLYEGKKKRGYQIFLDDDTSNQQYIGLLDRYNDELKEEVENQTKHIVEMHNKLVLGMATMVESRDNSTGEHIKRTSQGVRILINEIRNDNKLMLSDTFCKNIIKAAPMHDIGKIAVDDAVLRKKGRFTEEEYDKMKKHSPEGARIIREILKDTDDEAFKVLAENVAHYHHERWDGSGYPDRLKGEEIPIEARIMAIADVYDALVSKRVYKESMSFEEADKIIIEGMGSQFDPGLKEYYVSARPKLEEYYNSLDQEELKGEKIDK
ncbi:MAG: HD domain-containing protein [Eubacterium sp.]|nr:HD domain-containing protein [Eubacterium sp.]